MTTTNPTTGPDFSVADVLAFALTKPADEAYNFVSSANCALGQYAREMRGFSKLDVACGMYSHLVSKDLFAAALGDCKRWPRCSEQTFGSLAKRLEALIPEPRSVWTHQVAYLTDQSRIMANA